MRTVDALPELSRIFMSLGINSSKAHGNRREQHIAIEGITISLFTGGARDPEVVVGNIEQGYRQLTDADLTKLNFLVHHRQVQTIGKKMDDFGISPICTEAVLTPKSCRQLSGPIVKRSVQLTDDTSINLATPWAPYSRHSATDIADIWISQVGQSDRPVSNVDISLLKLVRSRELDQESKIKNAR